MKRYEEVKPKEVSQIEFAEIMGKLLGHALVSPGHAASVAAGCVTVAAQCRVFVKRDKGVDEAVWDKKVDDDSRYMLENAVHSHEEGEAPPEEPKDIFEDKDVTDQEILDVAESLRGAIAVLLIIGTAGAIPNLLTAAVLKGIEQRLKEAAERNGMDISDWHRQVANAEDRVVVMEVDMPAEMPKDTVMSKGGDA